MKKKIDWQVLGRCSTSCESKGLAVTDLRGRGAPGTRLTTSPLGPNSFIFMQFSAISLQSIRLGPPLIDDEKEMKHASKGIYPTLQEEHLLLTHP